MLRRELSKPGSPVVTVAVKGSGVELSSVEECEAYFPSQERLRPLFREKLRKLLRAGYTETPRSLSRREFVIENGTARKFWNIELDETSHTTWCGRIGTNGRAVRKQFGSMRKARQSYEELIAARRKEGYIEIQH